MRLFLPSLFITVINFKGRKEEPLNNYGKSTIEHAVQSLKIMFSITFRDMKI